MNEDEKWMALALEQAKKAEEHGEVPVGAVLVKDGLLVAKAHNQPISTNDPTAHAEIQLLRIAGKKLANYRLTNTSLYVTLEPCAMCFGAMVHARIERIVYGAHDPKTGVCGSSTDLRNLNCFKHQINITGGILQHDCSKKSVEAQSYKSSKIMDVNQQATDLLMSEYPDHDLIHGHTHRQNTHTMKNYTRYVLGDWSQNKGNAIKLSEGLEWLEIN